MQTRIVRSFLGVVAAAAMLSLVGCAVDTESPGANGAGEADETIGQTSQAFSFSNYVGAVWSNNGQGNTPIASIPSNRPAFLSGLAGNLAGGGEAAIHGVGGVANLWGNSSANNTIVVRGGGVTTGTLTTEVHYGNNGQSPAAAKQILAPKTANSFCFLTQVYNYTGDKFANANDRLQITSDATNWYLGGQGRVSGAARCATVPGFVMHGGDGGGQGTHGLGGVVDGKACWLVSIGGSFRTDTQNDGVFISYAPPTGWRITVSSGKWGTAMCGK